MPPAGEVRSLNHWTAGEVQALSLYHSVPPNLTPAYHIHLKKKEVRIVVVADGSRLGTIS